MKIEQGAFDFHGSHGAPSDLPMEANSGSPLSSPPPDALALAAGPSPGPALQPSTTLVLLRPPWRSAVCACPGGGVWPGVGNPRFPDGPGSPIPPGSRPIRPVFVSPRVAGPGHYCD